MTNKKAVIFTVNNNYFIRGSFIGKYETRPISTSDSFGLSKIILIESNIINAIRCNYNDVIKLEGMTLEFQTIQDMTVSLEDPEVSEEYLFKEDVENIKLYNIELFDQIIESNKVFGVIKGNIICSIPSPSNVVYNEKHRPELDTVILMPKPVKSRKKRVLKWPSISLKLIFRILIIFFLCFLAVKYIPEINFKNFIPKSSKSINQKIIYLKDIRGQKYINVKIYNDSKRFLLDTGASNSLISSEYLNELLDKGYISRYKNFKKPSNYIIADGSSVRGELWIFPKIRMGSVNLYDVEIGVINSDNITFLLGMSTLKKLGNYQISPKENKIIIQN